MSPIALIAALVLVTLVPALAQQSKPPLPSSPAVEEPPAWNRSVPMPDGTTWVSDGGLLIDAQIAKPAIPPSIALTIENGKILARNFEAKPLREVGLADLRAGSTANTFVTADGISLNGNYVQFLRRAAPAVRLRLREARDPIVLILRDRPVGLMMPLATPPK
jgi:hypothetical protein